jgi:acetyl esterase/lipase
MRYYPAAFCVATAWLALASTQSPAQAPIPRTLPPKGIELPAADAAKLREGLDALEARIQKAKKSDKAARLEPRFADVEIYAKAVSYAVENGEFFNAREIPWALDHLKTAGTRLDQLVAGNAPWATAHGLVIRGFRSALDGSVQPYGLVIPEKLDLAKPVPLIVWLHGRGDTLSEVNFIQEHQTKPGQIAPPWAIVLHIYGRYCNAFKSAGEVDVFEAMADVQKNYKIDPNRIVLWGFSMGGAGSWHLGAHYSDRWVAVAPGAGFADTAKYQKLKPDAFPVWYEQTLWHLYDVPPYVRNLANVPVVAYSGELDKQKQAADLMAEAMTAEKVPFKHLIGPKVEHKYEPETLKELTGILEGHVKQGRNPMPKSVSLQTRTLRYSKQFWVEALALDKHWENSRIDAQLTDDGRVVADTMNIAAFSIVWPTEKPPAAGRKLVIDDKKIDVPADIPLTSPIVLEKVAPGDWKVNTFFNRGSALRKSPGLQGPIDDVFMAPFLVVVPSKKSPHPLVEKWVDAELAHFKDRWRRLFRGDLVVKKDTEVTVEDMQTHHVILWGDRTSNKLIAQVAPYSPIGWSDGAITAGDKTYPAEGHVLMAIFPNPLQQRPNRYVVLNSGPTFREGHDRTNSLQNPKLPDWAVVDLATPPDAQTPGKVVDAGFFDEEWKWRKR